MGSMYGIFTYIWLFLIVKYGKHTSPMDHMGLCLWDVAVCQVTNLFLKPLLVSGCDHPGSETNRTFRMELGNDLGGTVGDRGPGRSRQGVLPRFLTS